MNQMKDLHHEAMRLADQADHLRLGSGDEAALTCVWPWITNGGPRNSPPPTFRSNRRARSCTAARPHSPWNVGSTGRPSG